jgi:hypothetical protein
MKKVSALAVAVLTIVLISATHNKRTPPIATAVTISTTTLDITSGNGVTIKYVIRGYEAKNLNGVDHGSFLNTAPNPEPGKTGSIKSKGVAGTTDSKGNPTAAGTFYCAAYSGNLVRGTKYYVRPYIKLSNGTILYGGEKSVTMK